MNKKEKEMIQKLKPISQYNERTELRNELIKIIALGGFAAGCLVAPGLAHATKIFPQLTGQENKKLQRQLRSLERRGLIEKRQNKYFLTAMGTLEKNKIAISCYTFPIYSNKQWNKKFYMVMFDVPTSHNRSRDSFRNKLKEFNFLELQQSVYISPFNYRKEIYELAKLHDINIDIVTAELSGIDKLPEIKRYFGLNGA